jgi:hypothetical protein
MMLLQIPDNVSVTIGEPASSQFFVDIINDDNKKDLLIDGQTCQVDVKKDLI